jgi:hypothetical protein
MASLDHSGIGRCRQCGKLIAPDSPGSICSECRHADSLLEEHGEAAVAQAREALDRLALSAGLTSHEVRQAMRDLPSLARFLDKEPTCATCGRRPPMEGMKLCLRCQIDALDMLRMAADEAYEHALEEQDEAALHQSRSLRDLLEDKRARTATANINPSGAQKIKNYRFN